MSASWLSTALKAAVSIALIWLLVDRIDLAPTWDRIRNLAPVEALVSLGILGLQIALITARWRLVARLIEVLLEFGTALRLMIIGQFFNQTFPSAIGGDVMRVWMMTRLGIPLGKAVSSILCDRAFALFSLIALVAVSLLPFGTTLNDPTAQLGLIVLVVVSATVFAAFFIVGKPVAHLLRRWRVTRPLGDVAMDFRRLFTAPAQTLTLAGISLLGHLMTIAMVYSLARALGMGVRFTDCLIVVPPVILATMLPISIGGWGVREGAMVVGFGLVGVSPVDALALSVVFGALQLVSGVPGGIIWLMTRSPKQSEAAPPDRATVQ